MKSIWNVEHGKRRRPGGRRSAGMRRAVPRPSMQAPQQAAPGWATVTSPGQHQRAASRRCWMLCCTAWTERTSRLSVKCCGSSKRCGIRTSLLRDARLGWRRKISNGSWIRSQLCLRGSTAWPRVWGTNSSSVTALCVHLFLLFCLFISCCLFLDATVCVLVVVSVCG